MMRKIIAIGLVLAMLLPAEACGASQISRGSEPAVMETTAETTVETTVETTGAAEESVPAQEEAAAGRSEDPAAESPEKETVASSEGTRTPVAGVEIPITDIEPLMIGQVENKEAATGCTVLICKDGMRAGLDVRGGGPASRESQLLNPLTSAQFLHAIVLSGGSAYGLGTANGVMSYLEEQGIGYDTGFALVPLVAQSDIYDLSVADAKVRPDADMGYEAAKAAFEAPDYKDGNYGAGCGASVGKIAGMDYAMKTGVGSYAVQIGDLKIGAITVLNALGDVYDWRTGEQVAGLLTEDKMGLRSTMDYMSASIESKENKFTGNTTLAVVVTNAEFSKPQPTTVMRDPSIRSTHPRTETASTRFLSETSMRIRTWWVRLRLKWSAKHCCVQCTARRALTDCRQLRTWERDTETPADPVYEGEFIRFE